MLIANGKKIDVYLLDTRKTLLDRIASSFNILPEYILDTNFPYILDMIRKDIDIELNINTLETIIDTDIIEYLLRYGKSANSINIKVSNLSYFWRMKNLGHNSMSVKASLQKSENYNELENFEIFSDLVSTTKNIVGGDDEYDKFETDYKIKLELLKKDVEETSRKMKALNDRYDSNINTTKFTVKGEDILLSYNNINTDTIESIFDKIVLNDFMPYCQIISRKLQDTSCFKSLKNGFVNNEFYIKHDEEELKTFDYKRSKKGLEPVHDVLTKNGCIICYVNIYDNLKFERERYEKCYISINNGDITLELIVDDKKINIRNEDTSYISQVENKVVTYFDNILSGERKSEYVSFRGDFLIPKFTTNIDLLTHELMLNDIFMNFFSIDEFMNASLKKYSKGEKVNIVFSSSLLEKENKINNLKKSLEILKMEISDLKIRKKTSDLQQMEILEKNINEKEILEKNLKIKREYFINKKFKVSVILENRKNDASAKGINITDIPLGSYFTRVQVLCNNVKDMEYFKQLFLTLCNMYKDTEKRLGDEYIEILKQVDREDDVIYEYKDEVIKTAVKSSSENPDLFIGAESKGCVGSANPTTIKYDSDEQIKAEDVMRIDYGDDVERCIYGIYKNARFTDDVISINEVRRIDKKFNTKSTELEKMRNIYLEMSKMRSMMEEIEEGDVRSIELHDKLNEMVEEHGDEDDIKREIDDIQSLKSDLKYVMKFPKEDSGITPFFISCPRKKKPREINREKKGLELSDASKKNLERIYPGLRLRKNKSLVSDFGNFREYMPCCYIKNIDSANKWPDSVSYFQSKNVTEKKGRIFENIITTHKILEFEKRGILPHNVLNFLSTYLLEFNHSILREGVGINPGSFFDCVWRGKLKLRTKDDGRENADFIKTIKSEDRRSEFVNRFSKEIEIFSKQECYDFTKEELMNLLKDNDAYINPSRFIHLFEVIFNVKIVLFGRNSDSGNFIYPYYKNGYYKNKTKTKDVLCIITHDGSEQEDFPFSQSELLTYIDDISVKRIDNPGRLFYNFNGQIYDKYMDSLITYKNGIKVNTIGLPKELKKSIKSQGFCSFGKTRVLFCRYKGKTLEVFTTPLQPVDIDEVSQFTGKLHNEEDVLDFFKLCNIPTYAKTQNSIVAKYNQTLFCINTKNITSDFRNSTKLYNRLTSSFEVSTSSGINIFRKNRRIARYLFEYVKYSFSKYLLGREYTDIEGEIDEFLKKSSKIDRSFVYNIPGIVIEENKDFFGSDKIVFSSETLRDKIEYNLKLSYKFHTNNEIRTLINYYKNIIFQTYYADITDFNIKDNEFLSNTKENFNKIVTDVKEIEDEVKSEISDDFDDFDDFGDSD